MSDRLQRALGVAATHWTALEPGGAGEQGLAAARAGYEEPPIVNALGLQLRPVESVPRSVHYEAVLLFRGEVAFRTDSYHDWFNLLSWRTWPLSKAALNLRHTLHYLARLRLLDAEGYCGRIGERLPRDGWMQVLANLDEGGCVAAESLLRDHARLDEGGAYHFTSLPAPDELERGLRWFGHAVLEILHRERHLAPEDGTRLRLWVTALPEPSDEDLARRILTLSPELEAGIQPLLPRLGTLRPFFQRALRFAADDPFRKPVRSLWSPW